jgi:hypothetical protein
VVTQSRRRAIVAVGWTSLALVLVHSVLWDIVRYEDGRLIARMADLVNVGSGMATLFRLSLVADAVGSYLLLVPIALHLWHRYRERDPWAVDVATTAALVYATAGAITACALAVGGERLIRVHVSAVAADRPAIEASFTGLMDAALGVWQLLGLAALGTWWVIIGRFLRAEHRWLATFSLVAGAFSLAVAVGRAAGLDFEVAAPATLAFTPIGVWAVWVALATSRES